MDTHSRTGGHDVDAQPAPREAITSHNDRCLGRLHGNCRDWEHCPYCGPLEQALRAVPRDVVDF